MLQRMQTDPALREVSHLVLDEIHERDVTSDFVITILKDIIQKVCLECFYLFMVYVMILSVAKGPHTRTVSPSDQPEQSNTDRQN
jgi:hypothetical protein